MTANTHTPFKTSVGGDAWSAQPTDAPTAGLINLYTYTCQDGIVRSRCPHHIEREGPFAPDPARRIIAIAYRVPAARCVTCRDQQLSPEPDQ